MSPKFYETHQVIIRDRFDEGKAIIRKVIDNGLDFNGVIQNDQGYDPTDKLFTYLDGTGHLNQDFFFCELEKQTCGLYKNRDLLTFSIPISIANELLVDGLSETYGSPIRMDTYRHEITEPKEYYEITKSDLKSAKKEDDKYFKKKHKEELKLKAKENKEHKKLIKESKSIKKNMTKNDIINKKHLGKNDVKFIF